jgi:hypothetical protein
MKFKVTYLRPKKKGVFSKQEAVFYDIEDAVFYEQEMTKRGSKEFKIIPT